MNIFDHLICPVCKSSLIKRENSLKCSQGHCFDFASSGYINLLKPGKKNNAKAGDSREMIRARTNFFACGAYSPIRDTVCRLASSYPHNLVVDAGCGEGYYTEGIAKIDTPLDVIGVDMSKFGCEHGAKNARKNNLSNLIYCVGSIFDLPLPHESVDLVVNMFAPIAAKEFFRVLKPGGHFIVAAAGKNHLDGLKSVLYDDVYANEEKFLDYDGFELVKRESLNFTVKISGNETIYNLFTMTPYYHRTSLEDKEKLANLTEIDTTVEVNFLVYKKI